MRLIDANELRQHVISFAGMFTDELGFVVSMDAVLNAIDFAQTVDAVEVVRCRDCKHRQDPEECTMCFTEVVDIVGGRMYKFTDLTSDNGYCHMGVKMDGGAP